MLLHGFPEAAFVWDEVMQRLAPQAACVAPNLRGYPGSSAPADVGVLPRPHLVADVAAAIEAWVRRSTCWWRTTGAARWPGTWRRSGRS